VRRPPIPIFDPLRTREGCAKFGVPLVSRNFAMNNHSDQGNFKPALTPEEAERTIITNLPPIDHHGEAVEAVGHDSIRIRLPFRSEFIGTEPWQNGSGKVFSGPIVMGFADTAMYCCVMAAMGTSVIPVWPISTSRFSGQPVRRT
jgi:hypothetical protein